MRSGFHRRAVLASAAIALLVAGCSAGAASPATTAPPSTSEAPVTATAEATTTTRALSDAVSGVAAQIEDLIREGRFSGVVLVADGPDIVWQVANGVADRELGTLIAMDTRFNLGSMPKMFTAVAVVQLIEDGELALDGTIAEYLPDYPNQEVADQVTIEQLLTHTSGMGDAFIGDFNDDPHRYRSDADYLPLFVDEPLEFTPGDRFSYSNAGYVVLGLIIAEVSGVGYEEYLRSRVFEPAGMADTGDYDIEADLSDLAIGYTTRDEDGNETGVLAANTPLMPGRGFAAGGGYSTAGDLLRFSTALLDHRLLSPASVDLLLTGRVPVSESASYALGFFDRVQGGVRVVGHGGVAPGVCSSLSIYPDTGFTAIVLSNTDDDCRAVLDLWQESPPR